LRRVHTTSQILTSKELIDEWTETRQDGRQKHRERQTRGQSRLSARNSSRRPVHLAQSSLVAHCRANPRQSLKILWQPLLSKKMETSIYWFIVSRSISKLHLELALNACFEGFIFKSCKGLQMRSQLRRRPCWSSRRQWSHREPSSCPPVLYFTTGLLTSCPIASALSHTACKFHTACESCAAYSESHIGYESHTGLRLITSYTHRYGYPIPVGFYVSKSIPGLSRFSGTRYLYPRYSGTRYLIPAGFQAQPGTARHSQEQTLVYSSYGKLLVHSMIYYVIYQIYAATCCSMQLHICSRFAYIMSTFLKWHICIINQL